MAATLLELNNVQKDYHIREYGRVIRTHKALNKLSFKVKKGQIFGLLGPNGAGKTTTIKCITGILKYDKGTISIDGKNIEENDFENKNQKQQFTKKWISSRTIWIWIPKLAVNGAEQMHILLGRVMESLASMPLPVFMSFSEKHLPVYMKFK